MGERSLEIHEESFTCGVRFDDLNAESQAFVLQSFRVVGLNPKTFICLHPDGEGKATLQMGQLLSSGGEPGTIGIGETLYSACPE